MEFSDEYFMQMALQEAIAAFEADEVPIGAVVVSRNRVIGRGYNMVEQLKDATAHAEMIAVTAASGYLGAKILSDCTLYVTIEPCPMCAGALRWTQIPRIVYGAAEPKTGYSRFGQEMLHPKTEIVRGVLEEECGGLMKEFFRQKRARK